MIRFTLYSLFCSLLFLCAIKPLAAQPLPPLSSLHDTVMVELIRYDSSFRLDVRYATTNNFTGQVLYDCGRVWLRKRVAVDLIKAQKAFIAKGYRIKIYDGYRPISVQWRLWKVAPKGYVSHPTRGMRMHNRGAAVDMTIIDAQGTEVDMGTPYDFFGAAAHTYNKNLPLHVQANRQLLRSIMQQYGFKAISNEWWHFDWHGQAFNVSDVPMCK